MRATTLWALTALLFGLTVTAFSARAADEAAEAKGILTPFGRTNGLCVVVGCGAQEAPGLLAEIASQSQMLVHGLAADDAALQRARQAIAAKNLGGRAMVECVELKSLPYVSDLVDLLVVADPAAIKGLSPDELMRVVAPEGSLCEKKGGAWALTRKARPSGMDDWTHVHHGADGNMVSEDELLHFPLGLRWIDGLPKNLNRWASVRGWVVSRGHCFALSATEIENLDARGKKNHYLVARNAFNGLPLWKINCETTDDGAALFWLNAGPLASDPARVYAVQKDKAIAVDAESGDIKHTFATKFTPARLLVAKNLLVAACWASRGNSKSPLVNGSLWSTWVNQSSEGTVEAFDIESGAAKWSVPIAAHTMMAAGDSVYLLTQTGNPPTASEVIAVDLAEGKERWRVDHTTFGSDADLQLGVAGKGYILITRRKSGSMAVLAEADGKVLWEDKQDPKPNPKSAQTPYLWTPVVDGLLWHRNKMRDPLTGEIKGNAPTWLPAQGCTPSTLVGNIITHSRGCMYRVFPEPGKEGEKEQRVDWRAARGACMEGMVPANGMFYTAQNNCMCAPGQVLGFLAFGPNGDDLTDEAFNQARPVEKGPAFSQVEAPAAEPAWPLFRGSAARTSAVVTAVPEKAKVLWHTPVNKAMQGVLTMAWDARLAPPVTAPVAGNGRVVLASGDRGEVVSCDASTGAVAWRVALGARIDSPPTLHGGYALVGSHDGWLYGLRATDGVLAWRTRVAPVERRVVANGQVESNWPAVGTVLVYDGVAYASAGRGSEVDGGVAVVAVNPATGEALWRQRMGPGALRRNDMLRVEDGALYWNHIKLDAKTGERVKEPGEKPSQKPAYEEPLIDIHLTAYNFRFKRPSVAAGNAKLQLQLGGHCVAYAADADPAAKPAPTPLWTAALPGGARLNAACLGEGRAVVAGALPGAQGGGRAWIVDLEKGTVLCEIPLPADPVYDGLALADGKIFVALEDGSLAALGDE